jgi:predicted nucleic acid-binding protein
MSNVEMARRGTNWREGFDLSATIAGVDVDPVAIEAARLCLDLFGDRLCLGRVHWDLKATDSTHYETPARTLIGNLPFGYRTYRGKMDVSSVILEHWLRARSDVEYLCILLPSSLAYAEKSAAAREMVRSRFRVEELILLDKTDALNETATLHYRATKVFMYTSPLVVAEVMTYFSKSSRVGQTAKPLCIHEMRTKLDERGVYLCAPGRSLVMAAVRELDELTEEHPYLKLDLCDVFSVPMLNALHHKRVLSFDNHFEFFGASVEPVA